MSTRDEILNKIGIVKPAQLSREDLALLTPEEINQAREGGHLDDLLGKNQE